ncbi:MAG: metal-binding protein, partial [Lachnospiraceae bacterium]|nr:metal-binding protein [Lachnospiraceae bacterium]
PMYAREKCLGNPKYIEYEGKVVKDCSDCTFPHNKENYEDIMRYLNLEK